MFCSNCGMEIEDGVRFCSNCGAKVDSSQKGFTQSVEYQAQIKQQSYSESYQQPPAYYQPPQAYLPNKSEVIALLLSWFVLPGLGQIYAGKTSRGLGFLFASMIGGVVVGVSAIWLIWSVLPLFIIFIVALVAIQIWNIVDAYQTAAKYNRFVARNRRPPQSGDIW